MRQIYISVYSIALGNGLRRGSGRPILILKRGDQMVYLYFILHRYFALCRSGKNHLIKQIYLGRKFSNTEERMQYQNSKMIIKRKQDSPFVQFQVAVQGLILNAGVVIQDCWLWECHVRNSQLKQIPHYAAIAFAMLVASYLKIVVMIILELVPHFMMYGVSESYFHQKNDYFRNQKAVFGQKIQLI